MESVTVDNAELWRIVAKALSKTIDKLSNPRVFDASNARGAKVYDVETGQQLRQVVSVNVENGEVRMHHDPLRINGDEIETYTVRFAAIHPIQGLEPRPVLFHCYGRLP